MARPNDTDAQPEPIDYLKRRFIRQNRELARINATQAIQIRTLELEISRLLAENVTLREKSIHDDGEIQRLKEKVEPDSLEAPSSAKKRISFYHEKRELEAVLSPIVEEEQSPVRLRSPITITRIRRPAKQRTQRRSAMTPDFKSHETDAAISGSPSRVLRLEDVMDNLRETTPNRSPSPLPTSSPQLLTASSKSIAHRSPTRRISIYQASSASPARITPKKHPPKDSISPLPSPPQIQALTTEKQASPLKSTLSSAAKASKPLQPISPNKQLKSQPSSTSMHKAQRKLDEIAKTRHRPLSQLGTGPRSATRALPHGQLTIKPELNVKTSSAAASRPRLTQAAKTTVRSSIRPASKSTSNQPHAPSVLISSLFSTSVSESNSSAEPSPPPPDLSLEVNPLEDPVMIKLEEDEDISPPKPTVRRRRDSTTTVSYAEPSLRKKMRRQSASLVDATAVGAYIK